MRLVLELVANGNFSRQEFERKYRTAMHGLIYSCCSSSFFPEVRNIHASNRPGLFCFSGLSGKFGENGKILENQKYKLSFSSPSGPLFFSVVTSLKKEYLSKKYLELGDSQFSIVGIREYSPKLTPSDILVSDGPIILTQKSGEGKRFVLAEGTDKNRNNVVDSEQFGTHFKRNLKTKSEQLGLSITEKLDEMPQPEVVSVLLRGQKSPTLTVRAQIKAACKDHFFVGHKIRMGVPFRESQELSEFEKLMDCGFGAMNGYGFGFMKKVIKND